jgi:Family of unknown function (DUF5990)
MPDNETSTVKVRLIHDGEQPGPSVPEPVDLGIQDKTGAIHPGKASKGRLLLFEIDIAVKHADGPLFSGPFVHGPPGGRFLYLSWKKHGRHEHPWAWRIKMPLGGISPSLLRQAQKAGHCLEVNVVGRRPHSVESLIWCVGRS